MKRLSKPFGWKAHLTSSFPAGCIVPNKIVCTSPRGAVYTCIRKRDGDYAEFITEPAEPELISWEEVRRYAYNRLAGVWGEDPRD